MTRILLSFIIAFAPIAAHADGRCRTCSPYKAPAVAAYQRVTVPGGYYEWSGHDWLFYATAPQIFKQEFHYTFYAQEQYADQGLTVLGRNSGLEKRLLADQLNRNTQGGLALTRELANLEANVGYQMTADDDAAAAVVGDVLLLRETRALLRDVRAARLQAADGQGRPLAQRAPASPLQQLFDQRCVECHSGPQAKKGLDLTAADALDLAVLKKVAGKIKDGSMPPKDAGGPLSADERLLFCEEYSARLEAGQ